jgi:hypothetical protein
MNQTASFIWDHVHVMLVMNLILILVKKINWAQIWTGGVRFPAGARFFSPQRSNWFWGPPRLQSNGYIRLFPPGERRPGREADHSSPSSTDIKNGGVIPPLPRRSSWHSA